MSTHFTAIGTAQTRRKAALLASTKRPQASTALEPLETHRELQAMPTTARWEYARKNRACSAPHRMYSRALVDVAASIAAEPGGWTGLGAASASAAARLRIVGCR